MLDFDSLISAARKRSGARSDRHVAALIGRTHPCLSRWRRGPDLPDDDALVRLCELAGADPGPVLAELNARRAAEPARSVYRAMAERLRALAPAILLTILGGIPQALVWSAQFDGGVYIMRRGRRRVAVWAPVLLALSLLSAAPAGAAECLADAGAVRPDFMSAIDRDGYEIVAWFRLGTRKQGFVLANAAREMILLRVTLAAPPSDETSEPPPDLPAGDICLIWRGTEYMARQILPATGTGL